MHRGLEREARGTPQLSPSEHDAIDASLRSFGGSAPTTEMDGLFATHNLRASTAAFHLDRGYIFRQPTRGFFNPYRRHEIWATSFGGGMRVVGD